MRKILSMLFRGYYTGGERPRRIPGSKEEIAISKADALADDLKKELPEALQEKFLEYMDAVEEMNFAVGEEDFIAGFRLCFRLMVAGLTEEE